MSTRAFVTSIRVSKNAQKNLGDSTHLIGKTRSMQMMRPSYPGADGITYANVPICADLTVPRWYVYVTSGLDTRTGPWTESASQTTCRMRGKDLPN